MTSNSPSSPKPTSPALENETSDESAEVRIPQEQLGAYRIRLELKTPRPRLDQVLLEEIRKVQDNINLKTLSRSSLKELFKKKRIRIKGQAATPASSLAAGVTFIDILGYGKKQEP